MTLAPRISRNSSQYLMLVHQYRTAKINFIIRGYRSLGRSTRRKLQQRRRTRRRHSSSSIKPSMERVAHLKRMIITTPGLLKNPYLTSHTVGPLHSHLIDGFTESGRQDSFNSPPVPTDQASSLASAVVSPPLQTPAPKSGVDTLENAIDFVLALEHPCMNHIPYPAEPGGDDPTNHMMLVRCF